MTIDIFIYFSAHPNARPDPNFILEDDNSYTMLKRCIQPVGLGVD